MLETHLNYRLGCRARKDYARLRYRLRKLHILAEEAIAWEDGVDVMLSAYPDYVVSKSLVSTVFYGESMC